MQGWEQDRRRLTGCLIEEILEQLDALEGQKALGVVLNAFEWISLVTHTHDFVLIGPGHDFEIARECAGLDHQAVISGCLEGICDSTIDAAAVVVDPGGLAVHDPAGPHNLGSQRVPDALMAEADAEQGGRGGESRHDVIRDSCLNRSARTRRDDQVAGREPGDLVDRALVVAHDLEVDRCVDLAEALDEVVGKRVVVVYQKDHTQIARRGVQTARKEEFASCNHLDRNVQAIRPEEYPS